MNNIFSSLSIWPVTWSSVVHYLPAELSPSDKFSISRNPMLPSCASQRKNWASYAVWLPWPQTIPRLPNALVLVMFYIEFMSGIFVINITFLYIFCQFVFHLWGTTNQSDESSQFLWMFISCFFALVFSVFRFFTYVKVLC